MNRKSGGEEVMGRIPVLLLLGVAAAALLGLLLWPFLPALVMSSVAAALVLPAHRWLEERLGHPNVCAMMTTLAVTLLILVPLFAMAFLVGQQARAGIEWLARRAPELLAQEQMSGMVGDLAARFGVEPAGLGSLVVDQIRQAANLLASRTLDLLSGLGGGLLQAGAALFTLFYLLRDREQLLEAIRWLIPLEPEQTEDLIRRAHEVTYATVYGNVLVGAVQGALGGLAFWLVGLPAATLWGTMMGLLSLLPVLGPPMVWGPGVVILFAQGEVGRALALLAVGGLLISTVDNLLRAILVSDRAHLHPLVVFFSVLGGLVLFGAAGILIGPVVFVVALTLLEMARLAILPGGEAEEVQALSRVVKKESKGGSGTGLGGGGEASSGDGDGGAPGRAGDLRGDHSEERRGEGDAGGGGRGRDAIAGEVEGEPQS